MCCYLWLCVDVCGWLRLVVICLLRVDCCSLLVVRRSLLVVSLCLWFIGTCSLFVVCGVL